ncbi:programmed cell death protein 2 isoform X2 [Venturia canescens]|uniref:programmed cell death protein 2 isoform X2 n=1 Tax=Venturia canescens TaxID=32260 RepID=UPI001C9D031A|nr:programmed cell death protein 2 isoform X2 [Venturia canescens]
MNKIDIGFVEECESWRLESRFFPSKVGGKPAWLDLKNIPNSDDLKCNVCGTPCIFLCQIYAPYEDDPQAFHRTLYVFVCTDEACCKPNNNDNFKILRCQLPRENPYYPFEPPEEVEHWRSDIRAEKWVKTCQVCGILAPKHCAKCKKVNYCCREHQIGDWKAGHKQKCSLDSPNQSKTITETSGFSYALYPEFELVMESENKSEPDDTKDDFAKEAEEIKRFEALVASGKAGTLQSENEIDSDLQNMSKAETDETFTAFSEKVKENPDQVLRNIHLIPGMIVVEHHCTYLQPAMHQISLTANSVMVHGISNFR